MKTIYYYQNGEWHPYKSGEFVSLQRDVLSYNYTSSRSGFQRARAKRIGASDLSSLGVKVVLPDAIYFTRIEGGANYVAIKESVGERVVDTGIQTVKTAGAMITPLRIGIIAGAYFLYKKMRK